MIAMDGLYLQLEKDFLNIDLETRSINFIFSLKIF